MSPLQHYFRPPPRIELVGDGYQERTTPEPKYPGPEGDRAGFDAAYDAYQESRVITQPEPDVFELPEKRMSEKYSRATNRFKSRKGPLDLRMEYGKLQVIVKLANIRLTPEKPVYEGGSWHVEGQMNENMYGYWLQT